MSKKKAAGVQPAGLPDDDLPRTNDWLFSVGFHHTSACDPGDDQTLYDYGLGDPEELILGTLNEFVVVNGYGPGNEPGCVILGLMPTRGHVRRLAAALGLKLNE